MRNDLQITEEDFERAVRPKNSKQLAHEDADLDELICAWPAPPDAIKADIVAMVRASGGRWPEAHETSRTVLPDRENTVFTENAAILENAQMTGVEFERYFDSLFANGFLQAGVSRKYEDHREPVSCNLLAGSLQAKTPPRQSARISRIAMGPYHKWLGIPTDQHPASHYNDRATAHSSVLH